MGVVQMSKGNLKPVSQDLMSEPMIVCGMALSLFGENSIIDWKGFTTHYDAIREAIEKAIPGFENYNAKVRELGVFYLPNGSRIGKFNTNTSKANFNTADVTFHQLQPGELVMMTVRSHDQFNTTIYGLNDRYRGVTNERRVIFMNKKDIAANGFKAGDIVDLYNEYNGVERVARKFIIIEFNIPEKCTATYFPETNVLVPIDSVAEKSNTPTSKYIVLKFRKHEAN
jgi:anaerobic selenocysteine-containing dehydrogenase